MKKYIYSLFAVLFATAALTSCTEENGTEPGNDSTPTATVYKYAVTAADGDYDADTDVHIRIAANNATDEVYYLVEKTADKTANVSSKGEEGYWEYVVSNGTKANLTDGIADIILTGLLKENTITVVAKGNKGKLTAQETTFYGITWKDVCTGRIKAPLLDGSLSYTWGNEDLVLQQREDQPATYRIKNAYGKGYHINFTKGEEVYTEGDQDFFRRYGMNFSITRMTTSPTPYTYGSYGTISLSDAGDNYASYCRMYEDYYITAYSCCTVSAGRLTDYAFFYFSPNK